MDNKYYYTKLTRIVVVISSILFIVAMTIFMLIKFLDNSTSVETPSNNNETSSTTPTDNNSNNSNSKKEKKEGDTIKKTTDITETNVKEDISFNGSLRINEKETTDGWVAMTIVATSIETDPALLIYKIRTDGSRELVIGPTSTVARKKLINLGMPNSIINSPVVAKYAHGGDE